MTWLNAENESRDCVVPVQDWNYPYCLCTWNAGARTKKRVYATEMLSGWYRNRTIIIIITTSIQKCHAPLEVKSTTECCSKFF